MRQQRGFTLVELAIVLVIIGLILGMAFKGKELIEAAKVKKISAEYNKLSAAANTYFVKYGHYPGDGCDNRSKAPLTMTVCTGIKDGILSATESKDAITQLLLTNMLTSADLQSALGVDWVITLGGTAPLDAKTNYMQPGTAAVDARYVCQLDQQMDDGDPEKGIVRSSNTTAYTKDTDCWALTATATLAIRILQ